MHFGIGMIAIHVSDRGGSVLGGYLQTHQVVGFDPIWNAKIHKRKNPLVRKKRATSPQQDVVCVDCPRSFRIQCLHVQIFKPAYSELCPSQARV